MLLQVIKILLSIPILIPTRIHLRKSISCISVTLVRKAVADLNLYHGTAPFVHAHDIYLQVWLETGLLGIASFVAALLAGIKAAAKSVKMPGCPAPVRMVTIGGAASMAGILVCGIADYIWNYPRVMVVFWFVFAVMLSGVKLAKKSK